MRILVTGGAGFIGSNLVKALLREGHFVRVVDNGYRGRLDRLPEGAEVIPADIREASLWAVTTDIDTVIHLADVNGTEFFYSHPDLVLDVAVRGMQNVLRACRRNKIENLLVASSSEVYHDPGVFPTPETVPLVIPDPLNPRYSYACGKMVKEMMTLHSGLKRAVVFRPHNVYGPDMGEEHVIPQLVRRFSAGDFSIQGDGTQTRSFCHIDDFTSGLLTLLTAVTGIYHIGNPEEVTIRDLARRIASIMSVPPLNGNLPEPVGATSRRCPDISRLKALGWSPKITLDDGLPETVRWYETH